MSEDEKYVILKSISDKYNSKVAKIIGTPKDGGWVLVEVGNKEIIKWHSNDWEPIVKHENHTGLIDTILTLIEQPIHKNIQEISRLNKAYKYRCVIQKRGLNRSDELNNNIFEIERISDNTLLILKILTNDYFFKIEKQCLSILCGKNHTIELLDSFDLSPTYPHYGLILNKFESSCYGDKIPKSQIKTYMLQLLQALNYCHDNLIIHRDINPSNILISWHGDNINIVLNDFKSSCILQTDKMTTGECGTDYYKAPEVFKGKYSFGIDIWSAGVIFFEMLCNSALGEGWLCDPINIQNEVWSQVGKQFGTEYNDGDPEKIWAAHLKEIDFSSLNVDDCSRSLLLEMLNPSIENRINSRQALEHSYFK